MSVIPAKVALEELKLTVVGFLKEKVVLANGLELENVPIVDCEIHVRDLGEFGLKALALPTKVFLLGMDWFNLMDGHYIRLNGVRWIILNRL